MTSEPRVIALLSGKGGSGKTTVAISLASLLSDVGKECLLVDLDLSTNGASYFFDSYFGEHTVGVWEYLAKSEKEDTDDERPIKVADRLYFTPSRSRLRSKGVVYEGLSIDDKVLSKRVIGPLLEWARKHNFKFVLLDCQAGYSIPSQVAARAAHLAVIVAEPDGISSDASDNLVAHLGEALPSERHYLVNKVDVRDSETYRQMRDVFATISRLPPLPFDFKVRTAFGARDTPIRIDEPSPLLFALFETVRAMLPELREVLESYRASHIERLFEAHNRQFEALIAKRSALEKEKARIEMAVSRSKYRLRMLSLSGLSIGAMVAGAWSVVLLVTGRVELIAPTSVVAALTVGGAAVAVGVVLQTRQSGHDRASMEKERVLTGELREVEAQLNEYRSLLWSQSKEYLLDDIVARSSVKGGEG